MTDEPTEHRGRQWHLDKSVSVTHIISTLAIAGALFAWASNMDNRVSLNEQKTNIDGTRISQLEAAANNLRLEIKSDLNDVNRKLDRLIEQGK